MFYKKRIKSQADQNVADFTARMAEVETRLHEIDGMMDVATRFEALMDLELSIGEHKNYAAVKIWDQLDGEKFVYVGGLAILDLSVFMSPKKTKPLSDSKKDFFNSLDVILRAIASRKTEIIDNKLLDLSQSENFGNLCDKCPDIALAFAKMAAKEGLDISHPIRLDKSGLQRKL